MKTLEQVRAIVLLPAVGTMLIPGMIIYLTGNVAFGWSLSLPFNLVPIVLGSSITVLGLILWVQNVRMFAKIGRGTLAPWDPTEKLVVHGVYKHVRNPMISGVSCILLGEAMLLGSTLLFCWFVLFLLGNLIYIPLIEESALTRPFGDDYILYKKNVPRWIPRLRPWNGSFGDEADKS